MRRVKGTAPTRARMLGDVRESGRLNIPGTPPAESSSPGAARLPRSSTAPSAIAHPEYSSCIPHIHPAVWHSLPGR